MADTPERSKPVPVMTTKGLLAEDSPLADLTLQEKFYIVLDRKLWKHLKAHEHHQFDFLANKLLMDPELPILYRVRTLIAMSIYVNDKSVYRARMAFELMDKDVRELALKYGEEFPQAQYDMAAQALLEAMNAEQGVYEVASPPKASLVASEVSDSEAEIMAAPGDPVDASPSSHASQQAEAAHAPADKRKRKNKRKNKSKANRVSDEDLGDLPTLHQTMGPQLYPKLTKVTDSPASEPTADADLPSNIKRHGLVTPAASRQASALDSMVNTAELSLPTPPSKTLAERRKPKKF